MTRTSRKLTLIALALILPFAVACGGGGADSQPAEEPQQTEPEVTDEDTPAEPVEEPSAADSEGTMQQPPGAEVDGEEGGAPPQEPQLVGNINIANANFEWGETTSEEASYTWSARVTNDTTANLDITVLFSFYDAEDQVLKTESATVRLAPAESQTVSGDGTMLWDDANQIYSTAATYEYEIVEG